MSSSLDPALARRLQRAARSLDAATRSSRTTVDARLAANAANAANAEAVVLEFPNRFPLAAEPSAGRARNDGTAPRSLRRLAVAAAASIAVVSGGGLTGPATGAAAAAAAEPCPAGCHVSGSTAGSLSVPVSTLPHRPNTAASGSPFRVDAAVAAPGPRRVESFPPPPTTRPPTSR